MYVFSILPYCYGCLGEYMNGYCTLLEPIASPSKGLSLWVGTLVT